MAFSPHRVLTHLLSSFPEAPDDPVLTREESKLASILYGLLVDASLDSLSFEEEDFVEESPDSVDEDWTPDEDVAYIEEDMDTIAFSNSSATLDQVRDALAHYRSAKKGFRQLSSMTARFRFISTAADVKKLLSFERTAIRPPLRVRLQHLCNLLHAEIKDHMQKGLVLHDITIRQKALRINEEHGLAPGFKASNTWLNGFKRSIGIGSRRVTKFVCKKAFIDKDAIEKAGKDFVDEVCQDIALLHPSVVMNIDQSPFLKEMHSARTLAPVGSRSVECIVQSSASVTHAFTVMPAICADGSLYPKIYVVLKEANGRFPARGHWTSDNLVVRANNSHIMNKSLMVDFFESCIAPFAPANLYLICDSWTSFLDHNSIKSAFPPTHSITVRNVPPHCTSMVQPLDLYFFRPFKAIVKALNDYVLGHEIPFVLYQRDNLLKIVSIVYRQFCAPRFSDFLKYSWFKGGYYLTKPPPFQTPYKVCFPPLVDRSPCCAPNCTKLSFFHCAKCDLMYCFHHLLVEFHDC